MTRSFLSVIEYCSYRCDIADGRGGVCVYVNSQIPCKRILSYGSLEVESLWLEIRPVHPPRRLSLSIKRQKALAVYGKDSQHYKELRNMVQRACMECKQKFYDSKVASLKESNISRLRREVKGLTGQRAQTD